jgi:hypothetical protein
MQALSLLSVTGDAYAGDAAYGAILDFSYHSSSYTLVSDRPTQASQLGKPGCGRSPVEFIGSTGEEAQVVSVGVPGGYAQAGGGYGEYEASYDVDTAVQGATLAVYMRVREGWASKDVAYMRFPVNDSLWQVEWLTLGVDGVTESKDTLKCIVVADPEMYETNLVVQPTVNAWRTYICTFDLASRTLSAYVDGSLVGTAAIAIDVTASSTTAVSGQQGVTSLFPFYPDARIDIRSAYSFASTRDAQAVSALHGLMIDACALSCMM